MIEKAGERDVQLAWGTWRLAIGRVPPSGTELARIYDRVSWRWDGLSNLSGSSRAYPELLRNLMREGWLDDLRHDSAVLDCDVGTGLLSRALAVETPLGLRIHGVDLSARMAVRANRRMNRKRVGACICLADARMLPFRDHSFDLVMSALMLEHLVDPSSTLQEMKRVLRPGRPMLLVTTRSNFADACFRLI